MHAGVEGALTLKLVQREQTSRAGLPQIFEHRFLGLLKCAIWDYFFELGVAWHVGLAQEVRHVVK